MFYPGWGYPLTYDLINQVVKYYEKPQLVPIVESIKSLPFRFSIHSVK